MSIHAGGASRTKRTGFIEGHEGNDLFNADSQTYFSAVIQVDDEPVIVRAHHLEAGDEVLVDIVDGKGGGTHYTPYMRAGHQVKLTSKCNVTALSVPGRYRFELKGELGASHVVYFKASMTHEFLQEIFNNDTCCSTCGEEVWVDTGLERCRDGFVWIQQENQIGRKRWIKGEPIAWIDTGITRCIAENVEAQQVNQCGVTRWVVTGSVKWVDTGNTRCTNHFVEAQRINQCGDTRWFATDETCGYEASYPLPGCGFMFQPGDAVDPLATVVINDCDGKLLGWLYPEPNPLATSAVEACDNTIIGYARNQSATAPGCDPSADCSYAQQLNTLNVVVSGTECEIVDAFNFPI